MRLLIISQPTNLLLKALFIAEMRIFSKSWINPNFINLLRLFHSFFLINLLFFCWHCALNTQTLRGKALFSSLVLDLFKNCFSRGLKGINNNFVWQIFFIIRKYSVEFFDWWRSYKQKCVLNLNQKYSTKVLLACNLNPLNYWFIHRPLHLFVSYFSTENKAKISPRLCSKSQFF